VRRVGAILLVAFIALMAPLSYLYGVDSRLASDRRSVGSRRWAGSSPFGPRCRAGGRAGAV